jgi:E3 ubiquitin-protein ligase synoviolin
MEDPVAANQDDDEQRRADEAAMEAFLRAQEEEDDGAFIQDDRLDDHVDPEPRPMNEEIQDNSWVQPQKPFRLSYVSTSFLVAFAMLVYALRTRQQWYLALVYLSSSKWAYVVLGNALIATLVSVFSITTNVFLNGLRLHEAEGLGDFFRWNITETCLALTMFRAELNVKNAVYFLILILAKCLHWVLELREQHLRMTEEAVVVHPATGWPGLQWPHLKLFMCLMFFQLLDILAVIECGTAIFKTGPSVAILFAFEGAILLVTVMSSILLWYLHVLDGLFHYVHETTRPGTLWHGWIHPWKDYKATLVFAVEVQAQAAKFCFYVTFFAIVMTYYGLPINLFREVYMSFQALKQRVVAFGKYRQLMASMNRFDNATEEELEESGSTCIICRDDMKVSTAKRLPGCGHVFHKSCLRDWLVQQQSCPTCRGDITAMQERQRQRDASAAFQRQMDEQRQQQQLLEDQDITDGIEEQEAATGTPATDLTMEDKPAPIPEVSPLGPDEGAMINGGAQVGHSGERERTKSSAVCQEENVRSFLPPNLRAAEADLGSPLIEKGSLPAFYRVSEDDGAPVYNNGDAITFEIRRVPCGVIVLGLDLAWRSVDEDGTDCLMVRVPDGWVKDAQLELITPVPF